MVKLEQSDRYAANAAQRSDSQAHNAKVLRPEMQARMEKRLQSSRDRINGGNIGAFVLITKGTAIRQVRRTVSSLMFAGENVIQLVSDYRVRLRQEAILAPPASALTHQSSHPGADALPAHAAA